MFEPTQFSTDAMKTFNGNSMKRFVELNYVQMTDSQTQVT